MSIKPDKPFFVRLNLGSWGGRSVDLPGAWGVAALIVLALILGWLAFAIVIAIYR